MSYLIYLAPIYSRLEDGCWQPSEVLQSRPWVHIELPNSLHGLLQQWPVVNQAIRTNTDQDTPDSLVTVIVTLQFLSAGKILWQYEQILQTPLGVHVKGNLSTSQCTKYLWDTVLNSKIFKLSQAQDILWSRSRHAHSLETSSMEP
jgi:hypothetical protein